MDVVFFYPLGSEAWFSCISKATKLGDFLGCFFDVGPHMPMEQLGRYFDEAVGLALNSPTGVPHPTILKSDTPKGSQGDPGMPMKCEQDFGSKENQSWLVVLSPTPLKNDGVRQMGL